MGDDYIDSAFCDPEYDKDCYHVWKKNGIVLSQTEGEFSKYEMRSSITFDYCDNFEWTSDLVRRFGFLATIQEDRYYSRDMKCFSSALTIRNVKVADLGEYQCHFGADADTDIKGHGRPRNGSQIQNVTLFDAKSEVKQDTKVEYFESFYTQGIKSSLLMQCVVTGGPLTWYLQPETDECRRWDYTPSCASKEAFLNMEDTSSLDAWRCYTYTIQTHSPHPDITESLIYFKNICPLDWGRVYCGTRGANDVTTGGDDFTVSEGSPVFEKMQWIQYYDMYYDMTNMVVHMALFLLVPLLSLFFVVGGVVAAVRGKVCTSCCRNRSFQVSQPGFPTVVRYQPISNSGGVETLGSQPISSENEMTRGSTNTTQCTSPSEHSGSNEKRKRYRSA